MRQRQCEIDLMTSGNLKTARTNIVVLDVRYREEENCEEKERQILIQLGQRAMSHLGKLSMLVPG